MLRPWLVGRNGRGSEVWQCVNFEIYDKGFSRRIGEKRVQQTYSKASKGITWRRGKALAMLALHAVCQAATIASRCLAAPATVMVLAARHWKEGRKSWRRRRRRRALRKWWGGRDQCKCAAMAMASGAGVAPLGPRPAARGSGYCDTPRCGPVMRFGQCCFYYYYYY